MKSSCSWQALIQSLVPIRWWNFRCRRDRSKEDDLAKMEAEIGVIYLQVKARDC